MEPQAAVDLDYTTRHGALVAQQSIQDFYDLVVELITNCDDSYHGQYAEGVISDDGGQIVLEVEPRRGKSSLVVVRDRAAGFVDMFRKLEKVGERTSRSGDRGFMARGLKDCASLGRITVETIVEGRYQKAEITPAMRLIKWQQGRKDWTLASKEDRERLGIKRGNGTMVRVDLHPYVKVPRLETLKRDLPWHFALRDIMSTDSPSSVKISYGGARAETLTCGLPEAELVHDHEYYVDGYEPTKFRFRLYKASKPLVDPIDARSRRTGILLQSRRGIHGVSFLANELGSDPAAENFFGRITCGGIDDLAEQFNKRLESGDPHPETNPLFIVDPNRRGGLQERHPFVQALYRRPKEILKDEFKKHRDAERKRRREVEANETTERLRKLAQEASKFLREKLDEAGAPTSGDQARKKSFMKSGVAFTPSYSQVPVGQTQKFTVRTSRTLDLPTGTEVRPIIGKAARRIIELASPPVDLEPDPVHDDFQQGSFVVRGLGVGKVQVGCQVDGVAPIFGEIQVVDPDPVDLPVDGGLEFSRKKFTVRPGATKRLTIRARFDGIVLDVPTIRFDSEDQSVIKLRQRRNLELVDGTTYYEGSIAVEGQIVNAKTVLTAKIGDKSASCVVEVVNRKRDQGIDLSFELVDYSLGQNYRATWDREKPNRLLITTQHESINRYLGDAEAGYPGQHSEAFRVLLAELISDNVCRRIVEEQLRVIPGEVDADRVYVQHNKLMREFTPIAHAVQLASPLIDA